MTKKQIRALTIIAAVEEIRPARFAEWMWPNSPGWTRVAKCGHGSHRGGGMYLAAGGYLGKLRRKGWLWHGFYDHFSYRLSDEGRRALLNHIKEEE